MGCGYLGLPLGLELVRRGWRVRGSTTTPEKCPELRRAGIEPFLLRVPGEVAGQGAFFASRFLVLNIPPGRRRPDVESCFAVVIGALVQAFCAGSVELVLFASSTSVYAPRNSAIAEADVAAAPSGSASGRALLKAEAVLGNSTQFDTTILRFAGLYGYERPPGLFQRGVIPNGDLPVNLVHRDDAVAIMCMILERDIRGEIYNVCTDEHPSRAAFYSLAATWIGRPPPKVEATDAALYKCVSNRKLKQSLGYVFRHPDPLVRAP